MPKDKGKAAKAIVKRAVEKSGGKIHRRGINMAPAVKKEADKRGKK